MVVREDCLQGRAVFISNRASGVIIPERLSLSSSQAGAEYDSESQPRDASLPRVHIDAPQRRYAATLHLPPRRRTLAQAAFGDRRRLIPTPRDHSHAIFPPPNGYRIGNMDPLKTHPTARSSHRRKGVANGHCRSVERPGP